MANLASFLLTIVSIETNMGLEITNVTSPLELTTVFVGNSYIMMNENIFPGFMTYYIHPNDASNTKYLWYGINENDSFVKSDIFTTTFIQYDNINTKLPLIITNISNTKKLKQKVLENRMCTSPITNDIMTCWISQTEIDENFPKIINNIECKLYFVKTNRFSNIISITNNKIGVNMVRDILCFNDTYFIPYLYDDPYSDTNDTINIYVALININGDIVDNGIKLKTSISPTFYTQLFTVKGSNKFNVKDINKDAMELFMISYETINKMTNLTNIVSIYGYYTNINNKDKVIGIYNESVFNHNLMTHLDLEFTSNTMLNWTNNCCYIGVYINSPIMQNPMIYAMITDIYGNHLNIKQYPGFQDIFIANTSLETIPQIIDLAMISNQTSHFFMIIFGNIRANNANSDKIIGAIYSISHDDDNYYDVYNSGFFDTIKIVNASNNEDGFEGISMYNLPDTNYLFFSWSQFNGDTNNGQRLYGQTWHIH